MKANIYDDALKDIISIYLEVSKELGSQFKGTKPFDKEPVSDDEMLVQYNMMTEQDFDAMQQKAGTQGTMDFINKMENLKARRK